MYTGRVGSWAGRGRGCHFSSPSPFPIPLPSHKFLREDSTAIGFPETFFAFFFLCSRWVPSLFHSPCIRGFPASFGVGPCRLNGQSLSQPHNLGVIYAIIGEMILTRINPNFAIIFTKNIFFCLLVK